MNAADVILALLANLSPEDAARLYAVNAITQAQYLAILARYR
jgi:hypothetical protein